jgi:hypothetical protein
MIEGFMAKFQPRLRLQKQVTQQIANLCSMQSSLFSTFQSIKQLTKCRSRLIQFLQFIQFIQFIQSPILVRINFNVNVNVNANVNIHINLERVDFLRYQHSEKDNRILQFIAKVSMIISLIPHSPKPAIYSSIPLLESTFSNHHLIILIVSQLSNLLPGRPRYSPMTGSQLFIILFTLIASFLHFIWSPQIHMF